MKPENTKSGITKRNSLVRKIRRRPALHLMLIPGVLFFVIFRYIPMWGLCISLFNYKPYLGLFGSPFMGLYHFERLFTTPGLFSSLMINTIWIGILNNLIYFPFTILLALLLNEVRANSYKRVVQTLTYIPHFMSWVIIASITTVILNPHNGFLTEIMMRLGLGSMPILTDPKYFRGLIVVQQIWKDSGWGTIIILAALSGIDPQLYEAARIDGANRLQQAWHITLSGIRSTVTILLILRLGNFLDTGFDQIYNMSNSINRSVSEVFDTYIYENLSRGSAYSFTTAVGLFKSVVGLVLILAANRLAKFIGEEGIL